MEKSSSWKGKKAGGLGLLLTLVLLVVSLGSSGVFAQIEPPPDLPGDFTKFIGDFSVCGTPGPTGTIVTLKFFGLEGLGEDYAEWVDSEYYSWVNTNNEYGKNDVVYDPNILKLPCDDPGTTAIEGPPAGTQVDFYAFGQKVAQSNLVFEDTVRVDINVTQLYLTVFSEAGGSVTVTTAPGGTVPGGNDDVFGPYACGSTATLVATPDNDCYDFTGWEGDLAGVPDPSATEITVTMDAFKTITATFDIKTYDLTVISEQGGSVSVTPPGATVNGPDEDDFPYDCGTDVTLVATEAGGYEFTGWEGDLTGVPDPSAAEITVTMGADKTVTATFTVACTTYTLTVGSDEGGEVTAPGEAGPYLYCEDEVVPLVAVVTDDCYQFDGWTGGVDNPNSLSTSITMDGNKTVTAHFVKIQYNLNVTSTSGGFVDVPGQGDFSYDCGDVVTLEAQETSGTFLNWTGGVDDPNSLSTTITMDGDKVVKANFEVGPTENPTVTLISGWNTFSTPIVLHSDMDTLGELLDLMGLLEAEGIIYTYENGTWYQVTELTTYLEPLDGYFVYLANETIEESIELLPIDPCTSPVPPVKHLYAGANLVGPSPPSDELEDYPVAGVLFNVYTAPGTAEDLTGYELVISHPCNGDDWSIYVRPPANTDTSSELMQIGKAYWVIMNSPDDLWGFWLCD